MFLVLMLTAIQIISLGNKNKDQTNNLLLRKANLKIIKSMSNIILNPK